MARRLRVVREITRTNFSAVPTNPIFPTSDLDYGFYKFKIPVTSIDENGETAAPLWGEGEFTVHAWCIRGKFQYRWNEDDHTRRRERLNSLEAIRDLSTARTIKQPIPPPPMTSNRQGSGRAHFRRLVRPTDLCTMEQSSGDRVD